MKFIFDSHGGGSELNIQTEDQVTVVVVDEFSPFTEQQWEKLKARWFASASSRWYATLRWTVEDVLRAAEKRGVTMTKEQAKLWWRQNESRFRNLLDEHGKKLLAEMVFNK